MNGCNTVSVVGEKIDVGIRKGNKGLKFRAELQVLVWKKRGNGGRLDCCLVGVGEDFVAVGGDVYSVLPLRGRFAVDCAGGPLVIGVDDAFGGAGVDHWLDGKGHPFGEGGGIIVIVVGELGRFVEVKANAVADKLEDDRAPLVAGIIFNRFSNSGEGNAGAENADAAHHALVSDVDKVFFFFACFSHNDHRAAVAVVAIEDRGDIDVHNVSLLQGAVIGNAVANDFVE